MLNGLLANAQFSTGTSEFADHVCLSRGRVTGGTAGKCLTNPRPEQFPARLWNQSGVSSAFTEIEWSGHRVENKFCGKWVQVLHV